MLIRAAGAHAWGATVRLAFLLGALPLVACGTDSGGGQQPGPRSAPSVSLSATLALTGAYTIDASFSDEISSAASAPTCAQAVAGYARDGVLYDPPRPVIGTQVSGHDLRVLLHVQGYHGPGTYPAPAIVGDPGAPALLSIDGIGFGLGPGANATVTVRPDNSGVLAIDKLVAVALPPPPGSTSTRPAAPPPPAPLSGTLSWTCATQRAPTPTPQPAAAAPSP